MRINIVSETPLFPEKMGGVHTAYFTNIKLLQERKIAFALNSLASDGITHIHTIGPFALYKLLTGKNVIVSTHIIPETFIGSYKGGIIFQKVIKKYLRFFYNKADIILALNTTTKEELSNLGVTSKIEIIPNPIDLRLFRKEKELREQGRKKYRIKPDEFVVLGAGNLTPRKGIADFITIAKKFPDIKFVWVGGSQLMELFSAKSKNQSNLLKNIPKNVLLAGFIPHDKMPCLYNAADIFLFPSYQETHALVVLEAAASGLPLVLRDLPEYKSNFKNAYIACKTNEEFEEAIRQLHKDKTMRDKASENSQQVARQFSFDILGETLIEVYIKLSKK
jgi:1,2-diacylglycerol-3-alpha-glucose alpha-1,2-galactosyltransferase